MMRWVLLKIEWMKKIKIIYYNKLLSIMKNLKMKCKMYVKKWIKLWENKSIKNDIFIIIINYISLLLIRNNWTITNWRLIFIYCLITLCII